MSVAKALAVLDKRYATHQLEVTQRSQRLQMSPTSNRSPSSYGSKGTRRSTRGRAKSAKEKEDRPILPAFNVCARDGPSPFDAHRGAYQCSIDDVLDDGLLYSVGPVHGKAAYITAHREAIERGQVTSDTFQTTTVLSRVLPATEASVAAETIYVTNPQRDRLRLQAEVNQKRTENLFKNTRQQKGTLYAACVRAYPHGALGVRESPYGEPGAVYARHAEQLRRTNNRECRTLRHPQGPQDHLIGSVLTAVPTDVPQGIYCEPPTDHLHGATLLPPPH